MLGKFSSKRLLARKVITNELSGCEIKKRKLEGKRGRGKKKKNKSLPKIEKKKKRCIEIEREKGNPNLILPDISKVIDCLIIMIKKTAE